METITVVFTTQELDIVAHALAQRPYLEVAKLMQKLLEAANPPAPGLTLDDLGAATPLG